MNLVADQLAKSIMGKTSLADCTRQELQQVAAQYPFFGPVQVLLLKKLEEEDQPVTANRERASLHFQNQFWLDQVLTGGSPSTAPAITESADISTAFPPMPVHDTPTEAISLPGEKIHEIETPATAEEIVDQTLIALPAGEVEKEEDDEPLPDESGQPLLKIPSLQIEAIDPARAELTFEPYHTVDYFASQGVKFKEEEKPKDRLSVQLRSFTEWLKTMKKVAPGEASTTTASEEKKVEQMAERSINDREVLTEAMAEVWEKQGNHEKAKDIYRKLSLLDPAKSSYFAAKIDHLK